MPTAQEILKGVADGLGAEYAKDAAAQDAGAIAKHLKAFAEVMAGDEIKTLGKVPEADKIVKDLAQLRADFDVQAKSLREVQKAGLSLRGARVAVPGGRQARREMLADGRAFADDQTAKEFGAAVLAGLAKRSGGAIDLPAYTRDVAASVWKESDAMTKAGDLDPGVSGSGAELVPAMFVPELIRNVEATGDYWPEMRRIPLATTGATTIPKRTGGLTAHPTAVAADIERSGPTLTTVQLTPVKWGVLSGIPGEFFRFPAMLVDVGQWLGVEIVDAINAGLDTAVVSGDGTAAYGGITGILASANIASVPAAATHTTISLVDAADIGDAIGGLTKAYAIKAAQWGFSLSIWAKLRNIRYQGVPIYDRGNGADPNTIDGFPYKVGQSMPAASACAAISKKYAFFGDLAKSHIVGMLRDIQIDLSKDVFFTSDMVAFRGLVHVTVAESDPTAIVTAKTAAA